MMTQEHKDRIVKALSKVYDRMHPVISPTRWSASFGQMLVFGMTQLIGYEGGLSLVQKVEMAHREGRDAKGALKQFFDNEEWKAS